MNNAAGCRLAIRGRTSGGSEAGNYTKFQNSHTLWFTGRETCHAVIIAACRPRWMSGRIGHDSLGRECSIHLALTSNTYEHIYGLDLEKCIMFPHIDL